MGGQVTATDYGRYDLAIVGGGCVGLSVAAHLTLLAPRMKVCLLEKNDLGSGGTSRSTAAIRGNYSHPELARMARRALEVFPAFPELYGRDVGFRKIGYVATFSSADAETAAANVAMQGERGLQTKIVTRRHVLAMIPGIRSDDIAGAIYEEAAGYAEPSMVVEAFARIARHNGVQIRTGRKVNRVEPVESGYELMTDAGPINANRVLLATAAWTNAILAGLCEPLPVEATRHQVVNLVCPPGQAIEPIFVDMTRQFYLRPEGPGRCIVGSSRDEDAFDFVDPDKYVLSSDEDYLEAVASYLLYRFPEWTDAGLTSGYSGVYDVTPDWQPLLGELPNRTGLYVACGFSGHGFKLSPVVGEALAQLLVHGEARDVDLALFRPDRFELGRPIKPPRSYSSGFAYR